MKFVGFTLPTELSLLERQGVANMYDRLRSNDAIALYVKEKGDQMNEEKIMELAAKAKLISIVGGKMDASYAPPSNIKEFARLVIEWTRNCDAQQKPGIG